MKIVLLGHDACTACKLIEPTLKYVSTVVHYTFEKYNIITDVVPRGIPYNEYSSVPQVWLINDKGEVFNRPVLIGVVENANTIIQTIKEIESCTT